MAEAPEILTKFKTQLMADKKKSVALGVLTIILIVVVTGAFKKNDEPAAAIAEDLIPPAQKTAQAATPPAPVLSERPSLEKIGPSNGSTPSAAAEASANAVENWVRPGPEIGPVCVKDMPRTPKRDLFRAPSWSKFPMEIKQDASNGDEAARVGSPLSFWSKLGGGIVSYQAFRRQESEEIDKEISELVLHSTMTGPKPLAHISGRLVRVGDKLRGFSVVRIEDRQVTLSKGGVQRVISMP